MRRAYIDAPDGRQVHFADEGEGDALILLHHTPRSSEVYRPLYPYLTEHGRIIAPDFPGFGASDPLDEPLSRVEDIAEHVLQLADLLELESFSVFGMNTGASVAIAMASTYTSRVRKLGLMAIPFVLSSEERAKAFTRIPDRPLLSTGGEELVEYWHAFAIDHWLWEMEHGDGKATVEEGVAFAARYLSDILRAVGSWNGGRNAAFSYDAVPRVDLISAPTLVIRPKLEEDPESGIPGFLQSASEVARRLGAVVREVPGARSITCPTMYPSLMASVMSEFFFGDDLVLAMEESTVQHYVHSGEAERP